MKIHEYQAKESASPNTVYRRPSGQVAYTPHEAVLAAQGVGRQAAGVVKAQIHAGGRGKARWRQSSPRSLDEVQALAKNMIGMTLVTHQTGPEGKLVRKCAAFMSRRARSIAKELYLVAIVMDRGTSRVTFMASSEGGVEIEEVADKHPEKIIKVAIDPATGIAGISCAQAGIRIGVEGTAGGEIRHRIHDGDL